MSYTDMAREVIADEFPDWEVVDDCEIICPHGHGVEYDGRCPEGCVSPFLQLGFI